MSSPEPAAKTAEPTDAAPVVRCPNCGSDQLRMMNKAYDPGCGCIGLLLFGWWGLLLGLLGMGDYEMVCRHCGSRWPVGKPARATSPGEGCGCILLSILLVLLVLFILEFICPWMATMPFCH